MQYGFNLFTTRRYKLRIFVIVALWICSAVSFGGNLLSNSGFETGSGGMPTGWGVFPPTGATYTWDTATPYSGSRCVKVEIAGTTFGMWQQTVNVNAGTVYMLTGYVAFENVGINGRCNLEVVFRDASNQILQFVDLSGHNNGTRGYELDFPYSMKFRAPTGATTAEVNCFLQGPGIAWFDDLFFGPAPVGTIAGQVTTDGQPLQGATVYLHGQPWGQSYQSTTDINGYYQIAAVPAALPRYIALAQNAGYKTKPAGRIAVLESQTTTVNFDLTAGTDPLDNLRVKYGCLELNHFVTPKSVPTDAVIPENTEGYPGSVREFLKSDTCIRPTDPTIVSLANQILQSVPQAQRTNAYHVAWAVYEWICKHINHDEVFGTITDVTSGIYQTLSPEGWCWGENFYEWGYKPAESLSAKCVICVEHSWLAASVLRALNIPTRTFVGSGQFWVQKPGSYGYWVGLSTNGGSNAYRRTGLLGEGFGGMPFPPYYPVTSLPFMHEDWAMQNECLWHETHPWAESYGATSAGLSQAYADMETFASTGNAPLGQTPVFGSDSYRIHYSDITVNLYNIGTQRILDTRFPMISESDEHHDMSRQAWWTNYPDCVVKTYVEDITNPPVEGTQRWFHIVFDLTSLTGELNLSGNSELNLIDLAAFAQHWLQEGMHNWADLNGDHNVNINDLSYIAEYWLQP